MSTPESAEAPKRHVSELSDPRHRFLSRVVDHTLTDGWRSAEDFLRHFPPSALVQSLAHADSLRVRLLVAATGTHEKIALKKSVSSATEDLELALAEQTTTPGDLVALYPADDKLRYLDLRKLWGFVVEDEFYRATAKQDPARHARATARLTYIVDCALSEGLITLRDVADGLTFEAIAASLPVADVREVVKYALEVARAGAPLTEERFLAVVPLPALLSHLPLEQTWQRVVVERVAAPANLVDIEPPPVSSVEMPPSVVDVTVTVDHPVVEAAPAPNTDDNGRPLDDDEVRKRVIERLRVIDRLPPSNAELSNAILLSVESMYADLWAVSDDDEREACIRESFPNQTQLRTAMLSLIELLDPSVDTHDPIIRDADVAGLIKIVLFEERRRRDASPSSARRASSSGQARARRSVPPPLPRSSTPPPLPGETGVARGSANPPPLPAEASKREG